MTDCDEYKIKQLREDIYSIIKGAVKAASPYENTYKALTEFLPPCGEFTVLSIGKAAVEMANAAHDALKGRIKTGFLVTKYGHIKGLYASEFTAMEASHPVSDENSVAAAQRALGIASELDESDTVVVLLSGGGSALFEKPSVDFSLQRAVSRELLLSGADISQINAVRKRMSLVKGGRFAASCYPAKVYTFALSDVLGNDIGTIASGITVADTVPNSEIDDIIKKYLSGFPEGSLSALYNKEELKINSGGFHIVGDIALLCRAAAEYAQKLGYESTVITQSLQGEARDAATKILSELPRKSGKHAYIYGGETTVTVKGSGKGGRNQEMALTAAINLRDKDGIVFASAGSDGTDGPTDAAGGIADADTYGRMLLAGVSPERELENNNSYYALNAADELVFTGATGTNVNDITLVLTDFN